MSTQDQIAVSYDVSNEFFRLWLDKGMNYSCGLFLNDDDSLEQAQDNKLRFFHDKTHLTPDSRFIDVGCGWGGNLSYQIKEMGVKEGTGITLSPSQYEELKRLDIEGMTVECIDYADYQPSEKFDAAISIGMFEHLATPEQARTGESLQVYRKYFKKVWEWTKPGSWFGLQSVIGLRMPRRKKDLEELAWGTYTIFPGAISPRLEVVSAAVNPYWEIMELYTRRRHYEETSRRWLQRLEKHEKLIKSRWNEKLYDEYHRYLSACVMSFSKGYQSLVQIALRRLD